MTDQQRDRLLNYLNTPTYDLDLAQLQDFNYLLQLQAEDIVAYLSTIKGERSLPR